MAARSANKATGKKRTVAKPKAKQPKAKSSSRPRRQQATDPQQRIVALEADRNRLAFELDTAHERIQMLEQREAMIIKRIDAITQSLHKLLDE